MARILKNRCSMDERDILQHLLKVEAEASSLVDAAQTEADRRVSEAEQKNRGLYEEEYGRIVADLDGKFESDISEVKKNYQKQLDVYRKSFEDIPIHKENFSALVRNLLFREQ